MTWILIRTTGFVAYVFLAGAAIWGLVVSTGTLGRGASPRRLTAVHESLSVAAILATSGHLLFLYLDTYIEFGPQDLLVPGASAWRPVAVSLGILAFYGLLVITASFYVRQHIGQRRWRLLHFASFGVFVSALAHGIAAGTDTGTVVGVAVYTATATVVGFLVIARGYLVHTKAGDSKQQSRRRASMASRPAERHPVPAAATRPVVSVIPDPYIVGPPADPWRDAPSGKGSP